MTHENTIFAALLAGTVVLFGSASAHAQATIDQNKALAGSVTPGDTPGFPITLSVPGSYKLTGNLSVPAGVSGVVVTAAGVTLDLNGFNIVGPVVCARNETSFNVSCSGVGGAWGVEFQGGSSTLRNGGVRGFATGVRLLSGDAVENLVVEHNAGIGLASLNPDGARVLVRGVRAQFNGSHGFAASGALIQNSTAAANGGNGFSGTRSVVYDSVSVNNRLYGFTGNNIVVGRTMGEANKSGDYHQTTSSGNNITGTSNQPF